MSNIGTSDPAYSRQPSGSQPDEANATACDYVDVQRLEGDQPRFLLQPHFWPAERSGCPLSPWKQKGRVAWSSISNICC